MPIARPLPTALVALSATGSGRGAKLSSASTRVGPVYQGMLSTAGCATLSPCRADSGITTLAAMPISAKYASTSALMAAKRAGSRPIRSILFTATATCFTPSMPSR